MRFKVLLLSISAGIMLLTGCVPSEYMFRNVSDPSQPVIVAAMLPISGKNHIYAEQMSEGLLCAEKEINGNGGISGRRLKVEFIDTCGTATGTRAAVDKAIALNATAVIAGYDTGEVSAIIKYADALRMPVIIPLATSDYHLETSPFVYRNSYSDSQQMEALAAYIYHWRTLKSGAVIIDRADDPDYSRALARSFSQAVTDLGGEILHSAMLPESGEISVDIIRDTLAANPHFILVPAKGKRAAEIVKALRKSGFTGIICGPDSWDDHAFINALLNTEPGDCLYTAFFSPENNSPEYLKFSKTLRKRFFHTPGACETQSYDALKLLSVGLAGVDNLFDFDKNWRTIRSYSGAAAVYTMLKKGGIDRTIYINSIGVRRGGKNIVPFGRLSHKLQHSKLKEYSITESPEKL